VTTEDDKKEFISLNDRQDKADVLALARSLPAREFTDAVIRMGLASVITKLSLYEGGNCLSVSEIISKLFKRRDKGNLTAAEFTEMLDKQGWLTEGRKNYIMTLEAMLTQLTEHMMIQIGDKINFYEAAHTDPHHNRYIGINDKWSSIILDQFNEFESRYHYCLEDKTNDTESHAKRILEFKRKIMKYNTRESRCYHSDFKKSIRWTQNDMSELLDYAFLLRNIRSVIQSMEPDLEIDMAMANEAATSQIRLPKSAYLEEPITDAESLKRMLISRGIQDNRRIVVIGGLYDSDILKNLQDSKNEVVYVGIPTNIHISNHTLKQIVAEADHLKKMSVDLKAATGLYALSSDNLDQITELTKDSVVIVDSGSLFPNGFYVKSHFPWLTMERIKAAEGHGDLFFLSRTHNPLTVAHTVETMLTSLGFQYMDETCSYDEAIKRHLTNPTIPLRFDTIKTHGETGDYDDPACISYVLLKEKRYDKARKNISIEYNPAEARLVFCKNSDEYTNVFRYSARLDEVTEQLVSNFKDSKGYFSGSLLYETVAAGEFFERGYKILRPDIDDITLEDGIAMQQMNRISFAVNPSTGNVFGIYSNEVKNKSNLAKRTGKLFHVTKLNIAAACGDMDTQEYLTNATYQEFCNIIGYNSFFEPKNAITIDTNLQHKKTKLDWITKMEKI
jgi:hypothetical protein